MLRFDFQFLPSLWWNMEHNFWLEWWLHGNLWWCCRDDNAACIHCIAFPHPFLNYWKLSICNGPIQTAHKISKEKICSKFQPEKHIFRVYLNITCSTLYFTVNLFYSCIYGNLNTANGDRKRGRCKIVFRKISERLHIFARDDSPLSWFAIFWLFEFSIVCPGIF